MSVSLPVSCGNTAMTAAGGSNTAAEPRLAIVMGTEGEGLSYKTIAEADYVVRIPMAHGVDSLNVATAAAVAFWQLRITDS